MMKRLSSKKAREALEFLCKKKLGAAKCRCGISRCCSWYGQDFNVLSEGDLFEVAADVVFSDGKDYVHTLKVKRWYDYELCRFMKSKRLSWASILKLLVHDANNDRCTFGFNDIHIISPGDTIEKILVEMELEDGCRQ